MPSVEEIFDAAYWASKNPRIVAMRDHTLRSEKLERQGAFQTLAIELRNERLESQGDLIDYPIMVELWGPYRTMVEIRKPAGLSWVPSALQQPLGHVALFPGEPPGIALPGVQPLPGQIAYDPDHPLAGSILVFTDAAELKPYAAAAAAPKKT